jgi:hypothetical protein
VEGHSLCRLLGRRRLPWFERHRLGRAASGLGKRIPPGMLVGIVVWVLGIRYARSRFPVSPGMTRL